MLPLSSCRKNYLYGDFPEVEACVAMAPKILATSHLDAVVRRGMEVWASLLEQGAIFKCVGRINWRVPPSPVAIPDALIREMLEIGPLIDRFLQGVDRHLGTSPFLRKTLCFPACPEEETLWELGLQEPLSLFRLDMTVGKDQCLKLLEVQVVMGGLGISQALRFAYGPHPALKGTASLYEEALMARFQSWSKVRGLTTPPGPLLVAALGSKTSPYRHEHLLFARHLSAVEMVVAPLGCLSWDAQESFFLPDGRRLKVVHRLFRSPSLFRYAPKRATRILSAISSGALCLVNPWKDFLEDKRILALVHHRQARREMPGVLSERDWDRLAALVPNTWLADQEKIADIICLPRSQRGYYLKKGRSFEGRQVVDGQQVGSRHWEAACVRAKEEGDWIVQESAHGTPWPFEYLDFQGQEVRPMKGYVRLSPFYFRTLDGDVRLGEVLVTAREVSSKVHGASDAILVVPGAS